MAGPFLQDDPLLRRHPRGAMWNTRMAGTLNRREGKFRLLPLRPKIVTPEGSE